PLSSDLQFFLFYLSVPPFVFHSFPTRRSSDLAVYPTDYLVVPRALAMMVSMLLLVAECIAVGIAVGYFVAIFLLEVNGTYYMAKDRKSTRLNSSHVSISYAVFCLKKKNRYNCH